MAKILVTGGAGYIGAALVPKLLDKGHEVRLFDRFYFGEESIESVRDNALLEIVRGDIRWINEEFPDLLDGIDSVVHLAGLANDPSCDLDPELSYEINVRATERLAGAAIERGVRRFVYGSTCAVYGHGGETPLTEESPPQPVSVYSTTQIRAEEVLRGMAGKNGFAPVILRLPSLYGRSPRMRFDLAINMMVATAVTSGRIDLFGGGDQWRPFLHVEDAVAAIMACLDAAPDTLVGETLNVGANDANMEVRDLADRIARAMDGIDIETVPSDIDRRSYRVDFSKLAETLGIQPVRSIDDGIREIVDMFDSGVVTDHTDPRYRNAPTIKRLRDMPAAFGGEPVLATFVPFSRPSIGEEEEQEVLDSLRSGWITTGPKVAAFERAFAERVGAAHAVAVNSCTAALHLSLVALEVGPGDEVITSPMSWASAANAIIHQGAKPVFVDIERETFNIDPARIEERVTDRTRAIIPVDMAGQPCNHDAIREIADRHGLAVIEDAAHAFGATYRGRNIGLLHEFNCFSFYPNKVMTTIEGGMVTLEDDDTATQLRALRLFGMSKDAWERYSPIGRHQSAEVLMPGYKYNMTDIQAAVGIHQLKKFDRFLATRRRYARIYDEAFADVAEIITPTTIAGVEHAYYAYIIALDIDRLRMSRDEFLDLMKEENVGCGVHFIALHLHKYYHDRFGFRPEDFPNATWASDRILSLPLYPLLSEIQIGEIVTAVKKIIAYALRR
ncbi:MAG: aminotransferase class I/II-fold pyridoxal phosphate-dependent enzyme [Candidatus Hydrogenedentes bacterium]|nr:aminotransferase class I/II-fold pyridoxal phosphate-dependent enzyme [Candidatus Hydrogenedentota bacterium]